MKQDKITKEKIEKYYNITKKALNIAKKSIPNSKEDTSKKPLGVNSSILTNKIKQQNETVKVDQAKEIIQMVEYYLSDAKHFEKNKDYINSFGAIYYAHGWLDCGARLKIFNVTDSTLFTI